MAKTRIKIRQRQKLIRQLVLSKSTFDFLYSHMIQPFFAGYKHYVRKVPLS